MKKMLFVTALLLMFSFPAHARIIVEADNFTDTISYRTFKNIGTYGIREYSFIKNIDRNENTKYFLRLIINFTNHSSTASRYLMDNVADLTIDGQTYKIKKAVREYLPRSFQMINVFDYAYYAIPPEYAEAIAHAKKQVSFTFYVPNRKPDTISFSEAKQPEIKNIIFNGHFSNYLDDLNKLTEKKSEE